MADFTQTELQLIAKALEDFYLKAVKGYRPGDDHSPLYKAAEIMAVRYRLVGVYGENLGWEPPMLIEGPVEDEPELAVGLFYRVVQEDHKLDGQRVKLERIEPRYYTETGEIRTWVVNGIMEVTEVPSTSLVACQ